MTTVLSASSVNTYQTCQLRWWFEYVACRPAVQSEPMETGSIVHESAESYLKGSVARDSIIHVAEPYATLERIFREDILPTYEEIVAVEMDFQIDINGIPYTGSIDSIDRHRPSWGVETIIRDLKTTGSRPGPGKYRSNLIGYYLGAQAMDISHIVGLQLDYIVRTQKPYYWREFQPAPDEQEITVWRIALEIVAESIEEGNFNATGLGTYACSYCPFTAECGPYQRYTEETNPIRKEAR